MSGNLAYQEERREELIGGNVVMMSPASAGHVFTAGSIYNIFKNYLKGKNCIPFNDGLLVRLTDEDKFVPDFMVVCDRSKIKRTYIDGAPDLVVEVLSPGTAKNDRGYKKSIYESGGVPEYWLISPGDKSIEVFRTDGTEFVLHNIYTMRPDWELAQMSEEERAAVETHFKCSLFDDLDISLDDIFYRTF